MGLSDKPLGSLEGHSSEPKVAEVITSDLNCNLLNMSWQMKVLIEIPVPSSFVNTLKTNELIPNFVCRLALGTFEFRIFSEMQMKLLAQRS